MIFLNPMKRYVNKNSTKRQRRHVRVRARVRGTAECPRLSVFRGNRSLVAQLIDDEAGKTLCAVTSRSLKPDAVAGKTTKVALAFQVGTALGSAAKAKGITQVVFDRGGYSYHGRVAAVAEGARASGLIF